MKFGGGSTGADFDIKSVSLVGYDMPIHFTRDRDALHVRADGAIRTEYPVCLKVIID